MGAIRWGTRGTCPQECSGVGTRGNRVPTPFLVWERVPTPFCTSNITWRCGIQTIILKHGCVLTDVLATRRFALLDKSQQLVKKSTNRKIQCGNSCRRMLTLFQLSGVVFHYIGVGTPRHVARNFDMGGKQLPSLNFWIFNVPYFQSLIHETCICLAFSSRTIVFRFEPEKKMSIFIEVASLKSLYLVKFQVSTLDESNHLLVKLSFKSACENLDAISERCAVCFYSQYCTWSRSHRGWHCACDFYIYTLVMYINTHIKSKPSSDQRCSRDWNCETETWSKSETETSSKNPRLENCVSRSIPRLKNLCIMPIFLKNVITTPKLNVFSNFWHFSYLLWSFLTCRYSRQKARWITEILLCHIAAVLKVSSNRIVTETCSLRDRDETETFETETRKNGSRDESRARDQVQRLHHR